MFQNTFSFDGRIRRTEYGISSLLYGLGAGILNVVAEEADGVGAIFLLAYIPLIWFYWAQGAKRCHDRGNSGWFQLIPFYSLVMLFGDSDYGMNEYGPNPKGIGNQNQYDEMIDEIGQNVE